MAGCCWCLAACSGGSPGQQAEPPKPPAPQESKSSAAIVWLAGKTAKSSESIQSVWVEDSPSGPVEKARRNEAVTADASGVWALRVVNTSSSCKACECEDGNNTACSATMIESNELKAVRLPMGKEVPIASSELSCGDDAIQMAEGHLSLVSMAGPWITIAKSAMMMVCGAAHPMFSGEWIVYNIEQRKPFQVVLSPDDDARMAKQAHEILVRTGQGCISSDEAPATLIMSSFGYDRTGKLKGHYYYGMPSNYACGTGPDHYSMVTELSDDAVPGALQTLPKVSPWLVAYMQRSDVDVVGVQEIDDTWDYSAYVKVFQER